MINKSEECLVLHIFQIPLHKNKRDGLANDNCFCRYSGCSCIYCGQDQEDRQQLR